MAGELTEIEVLAAGTGAGGEGPFRFTPEDLDTIAANFARLDALGAHHVPIKLGHDEGQAAAWPQRDGAPALGWVRSLKVNGAKLVAQVEDVPRVLREAIARGAYRKVSAEVYRDWGALTAERNVRSGCRGMALKSVAFMGADIPAIRTLADIPRLYAGERRLPGGAVIVCESPPPTAAERLAARIDAAQADCVRLREAQTKCEEVFVRLNGGPTTFGAHPDDVQTILTMIAQVLAATGLSDDPAGRQRALASLEATGVVHPLPSAVRKMVISGGAGPAQVAASEAAAADKFEAEVQAILMAEDADLDDPKARARATALAAERHPELAPLYSPSDVALAELLGGRDRAVRLRELEREMDLRFTRSGDRQHLLSRLYAEMGATTLKDCKVYAEAEALLMRRERVVCVEADDKRRMAELIQRDAPHLTQGDYGAGARKAARRAQDEAIRLREADERIAEGVAFSEAVGQRLRELDLEDSPQNRTRCAREVLARRPELVPTAYGSGRGGR